MQYVVERHKILVSIVVIGALSVCAGLLVFARSNRPVQAAPRALEVGVISVKPTNVPIYSEWIGTTDGMVNAEIKAQVTGYLLRQDFKEGSFVKKGQLLFEIDPRPFQAAVDQANGQVAQFQGQLEQANSQVTQAEAQLAQANSQLTQSQAQLGQAQANQVKTQLDVDKYRPLAEQKAVTQQDLDNAVQANVVSKAQVDAAKAGVEAARAQLAHAKAQISTAKAGISTAKGQLENAKATVNTAVLNLGFTRIVAPIDGIVGIAQAQVGNLVGTTSGALTTVSTVDPIKVYFSLSEKEYLNYARPTSPESEPSGGLSQLELELVLADGTTYPEKGKFYFADREVDPKTGAIRMAGIFPNTANALRPGQYGRVRAITKTKEDALLVPQRSVTELQGTYQVAVVGVDNKVSIRPVKVSERSGSMWVVDEGLKSGDVIVAEGTLKVRPGIVVDPKPFASNPEQTKVDPEQK
ncbi:MAG TPA: efflux RND transporter periplasmic adaptor subunit [Pyrinomonadaceae bacterium]|jgi:membrane fusion protein (multidrug efflux system)|nr:efflux RND transporter periplasmic adaptor subunit [Pyrinomonadaceae bacterium]